MTHGAIFGCKTAGLCASCAGFSQVGWRRGSPVYLFVLRLDEMVRSDSGHRTLGSPKFNREGIGLQQRNQVWVEPTVEWAIVRASTHFFIRSHVLSFFPDSLVRSVI